MLASFCSSCSSGSCVALVFRLRFQFSIRSLLVMVVVVAIPCSWLAVELKKAGEQREALEAIGKLEGWVTYDYWRASGNTMRVEPPTPAWLRSVLGDDFFRTIVFVKYYPVTYADLEHLKRLRQLQTLDLYHTEVTDAALEHLKGLSQLRVLRLNGTKVTDAGVKKLQQALPNCQISTDMTAPKPHWFHLTPDRLVLLLLAAEGLLWLSDRLGWPAWHKGYEFWPPLQRSVFSCF